MPLVYRYEFHDTLSMSDVEAALVLAILAAESLHGESRVRLDAAHYLDKGQHVCVVHAGTSVGRDLSHLFTGFLSREFGPDQFTVRRIDGPVPARPDCRHPA